MKKQIRINFCNFDNMQAAAEELIKILEKHFIVIQDRENPQYVFYSVFDAGPDDGWGGRDFLEYPNSVRIFYTGENSCPDFNLCDYAIGFDHIAFFDRYVRFPLYFFYFKDLKHALNKHKDISPEILKSKSRFCNFIVSNHVCADPFREKAFRVLSQYKHIDSAGGFLNNTGYKLTDKFAFQSECKFSLCFENSSHIGYITEKLIQAAAAKTIPIYWGDERACLPISKMGGGYK